MHIHTNDVHLRPLEPMDEATVHLHVLPLRPGELASKQAGLLGWDWCCLVGRSVRSTDTTHVTMFGPANQPIQSIESIHPHTIKSIDPRTYTLLHTHSTPQASAASRTSCWRTSARSASIASSGRWSSTSRREGMDKGPAGRRSEYSV